MSVSHDFHDIVGYVVLTKQPDGTWAVDWDGDLHVSRKDGESELVKATQSLGEECALGEVKVNQMVERRWDA